MINILAEEFDWLCFTANYIVDFMEEFKKVKLS